MNASNLPDGFRITTQSSEMDLPYIHHYLSNISYWAKGRTMETVAKSIQNSFCVGIFKGDQQVAFGRMITDYATFAYMADVFVDPEFQGMGLGKILSDTLVNSPEMAEVTNMFLRTSTAHSLYERFGFNQVANPAILMELKRVKGH